MPMIVSGAVPVEVKTTGNVAVRPTGTLPKLMFVVLRLRAGASAFNCKAKLFATPPALAVKVTA